MRVDFQAIEGKTYGSPNLYRTHSKGKAPPSHVHNPGTESLLRYAKVAEEDEVT